MIKSKKEFEKFKLFLPELIRDEVFFISLSARNKYLSEEERNHYKLSKTEMFGRTLIKNDWDYSLRKLKSHLEYKTTKSGLKYPEKALVTYFNINPSSMINAYELFVKETNNHLFESLRGIQNQKNVSYDRFKSLDRAFMNCVQKSRSRKIFIDIDCDVPDKSIIENFIIALNEHNVSYFVLETKSGYHIVIKTESLKNSGIRLDKLVKSANEEAEKYDGEVIFNKNQMIPLPGTLQAGKLIKIIEENGL